MILREVCESVMFDDMCIYIRPMQRTVTFFSAFVQIKYECGMIKHHIRFHPHRPYYMCCGQP